MRWFSQYREVLKVDLKGVDAQRAKYTKRLPTVLTQAEVAELLKAVKGDAGLLLQAAVSGCGLRVAEGLALEGEGRGSEWRHGDGARREGR